MYILKKKSFIAFNFFSLSGSLKQSILHVQAIFFPHSVGNAFFVFAYISCLQRYEAHNTNGV